MKNEEILIIAMCAGIFLLSGCAIPPPLLDAPSGKGWVVYHQSYNAHSLEITEYSDSYLYTYKSKNNILEGSSLASGDSLQCKGYMQIKDCKVCSKKKEASGHE